MLEGQPAEQLQLTPLELGARGVGRRAPAAAVLAENDVGHVPLERFAVDVALAGPFVLAER